MKTIPIPVERIKSRILLLRRQRVLIDSDLATLYGVPTKALNQAVKRNPDRFPEDFVFQLTEFEKVEVVTNCDHLQKLKYSPALPYAFTEHGAIMAANVLNSSLAVQTSVQVVRAFVWLRALLTTNADLSRKLAALEKKYDAQFKVIFDAIRELMTPSDPKPKRRIGFISGD